MLNVAELKTINQCTGIKETVSTVFNVFVCHCVTDGCQNISHLRHVMDCNTCLDNYVRQAIKLCIIIIIIMDQVHHTTVTFRDGAREIAQSKYVGHMLNHQKMNKSYVKQYLTDL